MAKTKFKDLIVINEAFDSKFQKITWKQEGVKFTADAELDGEEFRLIIETLAFKTSASRHTWLNLAFARIVNGEATQELISTGKNQSKVFGSVLNGLKDKVQAIDNEYQIDALVLIVANGEEKRLSLYEKMLTHASLFGLGWKLSLRVKLSNSIALVATNKIDKQLQNAVVIELKDRGKPLL
jgi:hypothetical protein